jgi:AraC family transcriptional activator of pobA
MMSEQIQLPFDCVKLENDSPFLIEDGGLISTGDMIGVFLCTEGTIAANIDTRTYKISKGDIFFYTPTFFVHILHKSSDFQGLAIRVDYDFVLPPVNRVLSIREQLLFRNNPCLSLNDKQFESIKSLMMQLISRIELENKSTIKMQRKVLMRELIISMGTTLLFETLDVFLSNYPILAPTNQDRNDVIVQNFLISLYKNYKNERDVAFYASQLCMTPSYFTSVIKNKTGKPALQWIIESVITDAKQMLQYSTSSIKEIALHLNFPTQSFFGKYFKQYVGLSPKDYRKKFASDAHIESSRNVIHNAPRLIKMH